MAKKRLEGRAIQGKKIKERKKKDHGGMRLSGKEKRHCHGDERKTIQ